MRIIKVSTLRTFWQAHAAAKRPLENWLKIAVNANWEHLSETRAAFPHADEVRVKSGNTVTVFNVGGNNYRLIVSIKYRWGVVYIRDFMTHAEYDKDAWKARH